MHEQILESIKTEADRLSKAQRSSVDALQDLRSGTGKTLDLSIPTGDDDRSLFDLDALTSSAVKFADGLSQQTNLAFVPRKWLIGFRDALKNSANSYENLANNISSIESQHGGLGEIDPAVFSATSKSGTVVDFKKILNSISANLDETFASYYQLRPATAAPRLNEFGDLFSFFATRRKELDSVSQDLSKLRGQGAEMAKTIDEALKAVKSDQQEIDGMKKNVAKSKADVEAASTDATAKLGGIEQITSAAEKLSGTVTNYQKDFNSFQAALDSRNADYTAKKSDFESLKARLDSESERIETIIVQADDMLKGATNAGLAASYSAKQTNVEKEIRKARIVYYLSIGLLVFLTLPIFIYSFPKEYVAEVFRHFLGLDLAPILGHDTSQPQYQQVLNFAGRAIFLIPGLMFVRFASSRHERLFRLREDYAYKYSIASSVDGFMKQAKSYADDIAAACYYELTYNPADRMDEKADDARMMNPLF